MRHSTTNSRSCINGLKWPSAAKRLLAHRAFAVLRPLKNYEDNHSLDTGSILRLHFIHRAVCVGSLTGLWLVASGFLCVSADVLFLCWQRDDSDAPGVARVAAAA